jgi:hypothetical protein
MVPDAAADAEPQVIWIDVPLSEFARHAERFCPYVETIYCHNGFIASVVPEALAHPLPRLTSLRLRDWPDSGDAPPSMNAIESQMVGWRCRWRTM